MIGRDFLYDNIWLSQYGMRMYTPEEVQRFVSRQVNRSELSPVRSEPNHYSSQYTDVLILNFLILKDDDLCEEQSDFYMKEDELNAVRTWLEGTDKPRELYLNGINNQNNTYYYGVFTDVQPYLLNDECYGLSLTFTCNAPYGFTPLFTKSVYPYGLDGDYNIAFYNQSSERHRMLSPTITINSSSTFTGNEEIIIVNNSIENCPAFKITLPQGKSTVIIDCRKKIVTDDTNTIIPLCDIGIHFSQTDNYLSTEHMTIPWLKLKHGENSLLVSVSQAEMIDNIQFSAKFPTKSGGF